MTQPITAAASGIGARVKRKEDRRFLTGLGRYVDDIASPRPLHARIVRSPHAHARIDRIDGAGALAIPGVVAVLALAELPECAGGVLHLHIQNDFDPDGKVSPRSGLGLANVRNRLKTLYHNRGGLTTQVRDNLYCVELEIPCNS